MALWLVRCGKLGEYEHMFLDKNRIYFTWSSLHEDLSKVHDQLQMREIFEETYPDGSKNRISHWSGQGYRFAHSMQQGDWVATPSKSSPTVHIGRITGDYVYDPSASAPYRHQRKVEWLEQVPRERFDQDILYSFGAFMTIAQISRNNAEVRIEEMAKHSWSVPYDSKARIADGQQAGAEDEGEQVDDDVRNLAELANDQISRLILAKYKGHRMAHLVKAILEAENYTVHMLPEGPDGGRDLLAAPGDLGFGNPRICVQVKSSENPVERTVLDQLIGVMSKLRATNGLLVSWGGFKRSFNNARADQFFQVRLWDRNDLLANLYKTYDRLPETIRAELPLKRVWVLADEE